MAAPPAKPGVGLREADMWRKYAWSQPFVRCAEDWDPVRKAYPARTTGTCRHKAEWLRQMIGGTVLFGKRTDKKNPGYHAVLMVNIGGHDVVADQDGLWPAKSFPFQRVDWPLPPAEPTERTWPWPWYARP